MVPAPSSWSTCCEQTKKPQSGKGQTTVNMHVCTRGIFAKLAGGLFAIAVLAGNPVSADVVIMKDGTRLEGFATTSPLMPNFVVFSDHVNKSLQLPMKRVDQIIRDPEHITRLRIGQALARQGKYQEALEQIREAKKLDPQSDLILEEEQAITNALKVTEARDAENKTEEYRGMLGRIQEAMDAGEFDKADSLFDALAGADVPPDVQGDAVKLRMKFYEAWGDQRVDKTDSFGAINCYEEVLGMNPENEEVYKKLMRLYEKVYRAGNESTGADATRVQRLQEYLEARSEKDPTDLDARLRLANLLYLRRDWDGALEQYLAAYSDENAEGKTDLSIPRIEGRLFSLLDMKHQELAKQGDYEGAIEWFQKMQSFFPDVDPEPMNRYEYMKRLNALGPNDVAGRLSLVRYCEDYGLNSYASRELMTVLRDNPKNADALKILHGWAEKDLAEIESTFNSGLYAQIDSLVAGFKTKYPADQFPSIEPLQNAAEDFVERARNEQRRVTRQKSERAKELAQTADENFERGVTALRFYRDGAGTNYGPYSGRDFTTTVGSYKAEAKSYFERALRYYREALALDPTLASPANGDIKRKRADAQRYLSLLTSQRLQRTRPGPQSSRRFSQGSNRNRGGYTYPSPYYGYGNPYYPYYGNPYVQPNYPVVPTPYGATPITPYTPYGGRRIRP